MKEKMKVVVLEPGKPAYVSEIENSLSSMQKFVGGYIEAIYPFKEMVCIVGNDNAKLMSMAPNRALIDEDGRVYDFIAGPAFICDCSGEDFESLSEEQIKRYMDMYRYIERFALVGETLYVRRYLP